MFGPLILTNGRCPGHRMETELKTANAYVDQAVPLDVDPNISWRIPDDFLYSSSKYSLKAIYFFEKLEATVISLQAPIQGSV